MSSCTSFRRESTLFTIFERNDNCIFLSIIPPLKLMVFSCCQTICLQQRLNELYSVNHHSALSIGQQPVWNLKGHGKFSGARSNRNRRLANYPYLSSQAGKLDFSRYAAVGFAPFFHLPVLGKHLSVGWRISLWQSFGSGRNPNGRYPPRYIPFFCITWSAAAILAERSRL